MFFRALMLGLAVFAFASAGLAQTSPGSYYAQQRIRLELLEKQGKITPAQRQAMELKLLQQLSGGAAGRSNGPKTGVVPNQQPQGNMLQGNANAAAAQQAAARAQAEKSREALKRKADGKKSNKKGDKDEGDEKKDDEKKDNAKKKKN